jgi:hypothetical protein
LPELSAEEVPLGHVYGFYHWKESVLLHGMRLFWLRMYSASEAEEETSSPDSLTYGNISPCTPVLMPPNNYRRRRRPSGPSKNELRAARNEKADLARVHAGTLRQRFPQVTIFQLDIRMEGSSGVALGEDSHRIDLDEPLDLQIPCPSTCGNGKFNLTEALEDSLNASKETQEGLTICQTASYMDARIACGTKLYYRFTIEYKGEQNI